jgi:aminoglycoside phosphotransferase (APT) family kinase protein
MPFISGREAGATLDREQTLRKLGEIAREIHSVRLQGYGNEFDEQTRRFKSPDFLACLEDKLSGIERSSLALGMKRWLTARVEALARLKPEPCLYHRDLLGNWGNFLVDFAGEVKGIIDWEFAGVGPAFHIEMASLVYVLNRDGVTPECVERDLSAVLSGYGLARTEYRERYERDVETFVLLNSVSAVMKFDELGRCGGLAKEPWRVRFAERAHGLCERCFANDRAAA